MVPEGVDICFFKPGQFAILLQCRQLVTRIVECLAQAGTGFRPDSFDLVYGFAEKRFELPPFGFLQHRDLASTAPTVVCLSHGALVFRHDARKCRLIAELSREDVQAEPACGGSLNTAVGSSDLFRRKAPVQGARMSATLLSSAIPAAQPPERLTSLAAKSRATKERSFLLSEGM